MSARQRAPQGGKKAGSVQSPSQDEFIDASPVKSSSLTSEWDYKLAITVITALAFVTRFWGIGHPNEVVFDEVHFGKVWGVLNNPPGVSCCTGDAREVLICRIR